MNDEERNRTGTIRGQSETRARKALQHRDLNGAIHARRIEEPMFHELKTAGNIGRRRTRCLSERTCQQSQR